MEEIFMNISQSLGEDAEYSGGFLSVKISMVFYLNTSGAAGTLKECIANTQLREYGRYF